MGRGIFRYREETASPNTGTTDVSSCNTTTTHIEFGTIGLIPANIPLQIKGDQYKASVSKCLTQKFGMSKFSGLCAPIVHVPPMAKVTSRLIPDLATHYTYCYPSHNIADIIASNKELVNNYLTIMNPTITFFVFGGLAFLEKIDENTYRSLSSCAMVVSDQGCEFERPVVWQSRFSKCIEIEGRFQDVLDFNLKEQGVRKFAYIAPNEQFYCITTGDRWVPSPNGGFVFLYGEETDHLCKKAQLYNFRQPVTDMILDANLQVPFGLEAIRPRYTDIMLHIQINRAMRKAQLD